MLKKSLAILATVMATGVFAYSVGSNGNLQLNCQEKLNGENYAHVTKHVPVKMYYQVFEKKENVNPSNINTFNTIIKEYNQMMNNFIKESNQIMQKLLQQQNITFAAPDISFQQIQRNFNQTLTRLRKKFGHIKMNKTGVEFTIPADELASMRNGDREVLYYQVNNKRIRIVITKLNNAYTIKVSQ